MLASTSAANIVESDLAKGGAKGVSAAAAEGMQLRGAASVVDFTELGIPVTQMVSIDGVEVYSQSAGFILLNECTASDAATVADPSKPEIKVCGEFSQIFMVRFCEKMSP